MRTSSTASMREQAARLVQWPISSMLGMCGKVSQHFRRAGRSSSPATPKRFGSSLPAIPSTNAAKGDKLVGASRSPFLSLYEVHQRWQKLRRKRHSAVLASTWYPQLLDPHWPKRCISMPKEETRCARGAYIAIEEEKREMTR